MTFPFDNRFPVESLIRHQVVRLEGWPVRMHRLLAWHVWSVAGMACTGWIGCFAEPIGSAAVILCGVPTWSVEAFA